MIQRNSADVLCGSGNGVMNNPGNIFFRSLVKERCLNYSQAQQQCQRREIRQSIIEAVRREGRRFLKQDGVGGWYVLSDDVALEKIAQAFRDQLNKKKKGVNQEEKRSSSMSISDSVNDLSMHLLECDISKINMDGECSRDIAENMLQESPSTITGPSSRDVLCGSGNGVKKHAGNQRFRVLVKEKCAAYSQGEKSAKWTIGESIVKEIQSTGGRFLRQLKKDQWSAISHDEAVDKTCQALRDQLSKNKQPKMESMGMKNRLETGNGHKQQQCRNKEGHDGQMYTVYPQRSKYEILQGKHQDEYDADMELLCDSLKTFAVSEGNISSTPISMNMSS